MSARTMIAAPCALRAESGRTWRYWRRIRHGISVVVCLSAALIVPGCNCSGTGTASLSDIPDLYALNVKAWLESGHLSDFDVFRIERAGDGRGIELWSLNDDVIVLHADFSSCVEIGDDKHRPAINDQGTLACWRSESDELCLADGTCTPFSAWSGFNIDNAANYCAWGMHGFAVARVTDPTNVIAASGPATESGDYVRGVATTSDGVCVYGGSRLKGNDDLWCCFVSIDGDTIQTGPIRRIPCPMSDANTFSVWDVSPWRRLVLTAARRKSLGVQSGSEFYVYNYETGDMTHLDSRFEGSPMFLEEGTIPRGM